MPTLKRPKYVKKPTRKGIGIGSGIGKTSGRGGKGQTVRGRGKVAPYFEGGQTPLHRRLPKRGFNSTFKIEYDIVNVEKLNVFSDGDEVNIETLKQKGLVKGKNPVKILGNGELKVKKLVVKVNKVSASAREKLTRNQCSIQLID
ncbi:MAG: 50S ribosomal protein L15 [Brevinematales bacterium]|nr:50S ribosomal protein L15 [Brevinematales bacterium]